MCNKIKHGVLFAYCFKQIDDNKSANGHVCWRVLKDKQHRICGIMKTCCNVDIRADKKNPWKNVWKCCVPIRQCVCIVWFVHLVPLACTQVLLRWAEWLFSTTQPATTSLTAILHYTGFPTSLHRIFNIRQKLFYQNQTCNDDLDSCTSKHQIPKGVCWNYL